MTGEAGEVFHFIAIGGIGQSALAKILLQKGSKVSGSDIVDSKYLKELRDLGAEIFIGHDAKNVPDDAKIVLSTAIKEDNPELMRAHKLGLPILHRSDVLKLISDFYPNFIGFSGTHGKTTTSGLCAYVLSKIGIEPGFAVGGIIPELQTNGEFGNSSYFVAELDESDGTILKYSPYLTVINNLESDHFDFFEAGLDAILYTFKTYVDNLKQGAKLILNIDDLGNLKFIKENLRAGQFLTFSCTKPATYEARNVVYEAGGSSFEAYKEGEFLGDIKLNTPGTHNVYNALAVISALLELGFEFSEIQPHFETFTGMGRRFQLVREFDGIKIIDDYAHHPTEILTTLEAAKKYSYSTGGRVIAIFQPHRYTRLKGLWEEFLGAFKDANLLIILDVYKAGETAEKGFESEDFAAQINHDNAIYIKGTIEQAAKEIQSRGLLQAGDVVLTLGAGDITKMGGALYDVR